MDRHRRRALRAALLATEPWLAATDLGPQAVDAGVCDRCTERPRVVPTCGPDGYPGLCAGCAEVLGADAWCDGHGAEADAALRWLAALPPYADTVVTLWWIATGEVRTGAPTLEVVAALPPAVRDALPAIDG